MDKKNDSRRAFISGFIVALLPVLIATIINNYFENKRLSITLENNKVIVESERLYKEKIRLYSEYIVEINKNMAIEKGGTWSLMIKTLELRLVAPSEIVNLSHDIMENIRTEQKDSEYFGNLISLINKITMLMRKDLGNTDNAVIGFGEIQKD